MSKGWRAIQLIFIVFRAWLDKLTTNGELVQRFSMIIMTQMGYARLLMWVIDTKGQILLNVGVVFCVPTEARKRNLNFYGERNNEL